MQRLVQILRAFDELDSRPEVKKVGTAAVVRPPASLAHQRVARAGQGTVTIRTTDEG
jgi:hypothetical protein